MKSINFFFCTCIILSPFSPIYHDYNDVSETIRNLYLRKKTKQLQKQIKSVCFFVMVVSMTPHTVKLITLNNCVSTVVRDPSSIVCFPPSLVNRLSFVRHPSIVVIYIFFSETNGPNVTKLYLTIPYGIQFEIIRGFDPGLLLLKKGDGCNMQYFVVYISYKKSVKANLTYIS